MNSTTCRLDTRARRPKHLMLIIGALSSVLLGVAGGCQGRSEPLSEPARILYDSLLAANEAMYDSASANLGFGRLGCLGHRARATFGTALVSQLDREAEVAVRSRHSGTELAAGRRGIEMLQPVSDSAYCRRIDSLWYARLATKPRARP